MIMAPDESVFIVPQVRQWEAGGGRVLPRGLLGEHRGGGGQFPPEALARVRKEHFFQRSVCGGERIFSVDYTRNVCYFLLTFVLK